MNAETAHRIWMAVGFLGQALFSSRFLVQWVASERRKASVIMEDMKQRTSDIAGVMIEFLKAENGPAQGKPIQIQVSARNQELLLATADKIKQGMQDTPGFVGIEDSLPQPGIEWRLEIDREQAARYAADVNMLGQAVQMVTGANHYFNDADDDLVSAVVAWLDTLDAAAAHE